MSNNAAAQHSANIIAAQWEAFEGRLENFHPDESYNQVQRDFLQQLMNADGQMKYDAKTTFTMVRDEWCALIPQETVADLVPFNSIPARQRQAIFLSMRPELRKALQARQDAMPLEGLTPGQELFKFLEIHDDSLSLSLMVDIGINLGFRYQPSSNSWHLAGKAYLLGQMCRQLFLSLHPDAADIVPSR